MSQDFNSMTSGYDVPLEATIVSTEKSRRQRNGDAFNKWATFLIIAVLWSPAATWLLMLFIPAAAALFGVIAAPGYWAVYAVYALALGLRFLWVKP
jgi:hypothetical protein